MGDEDFQSFGKEQYRPARTNDAHSYDPYVSDRFCHA